MSSIETLRKTRALLEPPERWTKGAFARLADGVGTGSSNPLATRFCLQGAFNRQSEQICDDIAYEALNSAARARGSDTSVVYNDAPETTHADVLSLIDDAIAILESEMTP